MRNQHKFYLDNKVFLLRKHSNKYVVIKGKRVIASYDSYDAAETETLKSFSTGTFLIQHCTESNAVAG
jgi:hypothetical protein